MLLQNDLDLDLQEAQLSSSELFDMYKKQFILWYGIFSPSQNSDILENLEYHLRLLYSFW